MKALVVNLCDLGDVLFGTPVAAALARTHEVHHLVDGTCASALAGHPGITRLWTVPRREWTAALADESTRGEALASAHAWAEGLRDQGFDLVVNLQAHPLAAALAALAGGRRLVGFVPDGKGPVGASPEAEVLVRHLRRFETRGDDGLHAAEANLSVLDPALWAGQRGLTVALDPRAADAAAKDLDGGSRWIGLLPGAGGAAKRWGLPRWRFLIRLWRRSHRTDRFAVFGGPDDRERGAVLGKLPGVHDFTGRWPLPATAARIGRCAAVLGADTGPLHLAAALEVPCVGLFGPTHPQESGPLSPRSIALRSPTRRLDDLEAPPVARGLEALVSGSAPVGLDGAHVWRGRHLEAGRIRGAWSAAKAPLWAARQEHVDGVLPIDALAKRLMERARTGIERLEGPSQALVHLYLCLSFRVFKEEHP